MQLSVIAYVKGSNDAVEFYKKAFNGELGYNCLNQDGTFMHAEITKNGQTILAVGETNDWLDKGHNMQFGVNLGNEVDVKTAYEVLKDGAEILFELGPSFYNQLMFDLIDKYGVRWYIAY